MEVLESEVKEIIETTPTSCISQIHAYIDNILEAFGVTPDYAQICPYLDNISITKSNPETGILTFNFINKGITVTITYRDDYTNNS